MVGDFSASLRFGRYAFGYADLTGKMTFNKIASLLKPRLYRKLSVVGEFALLLPSAVSSFIVISSLPRDRRLVIASLLAPQSKDSHFPCLPQFPLLSSSRACREIAA